MNSESTSQPTAQTAVDFLNRLHAADPQAMSGLIRLSTYCNEDLANDPSTPVWAPLLGQSKLFVISVLGLLNGLLTELGSDKVAAILDDETRELKGFQIYKAETDK